MRAPLLRSLPALIPLFLALVASNANGQCTKKISELPAVPELLGFRLGMTKDEVKAYVPQTVFGRKDHFGVAKVTINPAFDPTIDKNKFPSVRSISLDLLDDRLTSIWIGYDETYKVQTVDEFEKIISDSLKVPQSWSAARGRGVQLNCADFQLQVSTVAGSPTLRLLDTAADDAVAARRQAKEEEDAAAENAATEEPTITGDKKAKVFYLRSCPPATEISEANKITFKTAEEAEKAGFKLAKGCQ